MARFAQRPAAVAAAAVAAATTAAAAASVTAVGRLGAAATALAVAAAAAPDAEPPIDTDDDCEVVALWLGRPVIDWAHLRVQLGLYLMGREPYDTVEPLLLEAWRRREESERQCPLGFVSVCLALSKSADIFSCSDGFRPLRILASRWPVFLQLKLLQEKLADDAWSCDYSEHPSLDWPDFRRKAISFAEVVPPWLAGETEFESLPPEFNEALSEAQGIVWKASSAAVFEGRSISDWTNDCSFGVLSATLVRVAGIILGSGDTYRIVQRGLENMEQAWRSLPEILRSPWPVCGLLHALSLMKVTLHDSRLAPPDLLPLPQRGERSLLEEAAEVAASGPGDTGLEATAAEQWRSPTWRSAVEVLRRAGGAQGTVLLTSLPHWRIHFLQPFLKHADKLGFISHVAIAPLLPNMTAACNDIVEGFMEFKRPTVPRGWSPCLPWISQFWARVQFLYIYLALQVQLAVLFFDWHVFWVRSPLPWMLERMTGQPSPLPYRTECDMTCPPVKRADVYLLDEFYARFRTKTQLVLALPTRAAREWILEMIRWLFTFPFASAKGALRYLAHPYEPDAVPSMSMLPAPKDMPRIELGELDVEQLFISTDGWHGNVDNVLSLEIGAFLADSDRYFFLDTLFGGSQVAINNLLLQLRKPTSPLRPTERLRLRAAEEAEHPEPHKLRECTWETAHNRYLGGFAASIETEYESLEMAQCECVRLGKRCAGVTCEPVNNEMVCTLREGNPFLAPSPYSEDSHIKQCLGTGCDPPEVLRVVHVNFADGCCEAEQNQSSETSLLFGADETRPLRGDFLDEDFRTRNDHLLRFNRTPELTQHKTPTGKIGYYVWKPYVVLRTVEDPTLPWDTTVVAWTDAGIHFVGDMRPLIEKSLRNSDVSATRTPMMEGDFSKRDAFILLDADYSAIVESNQVATGFILVRKTPLAVEFLRAWLRACEDPRIMTEEPSVLGQPEHFSFLNNNDDQTAFSLLFKKYGFQPFSVGQRDEVVYTGRNLAKFIKASDDFALGIKGDRDDYLKAADDAAKRRSEAAAVGSTVSP